MPARSQLSALLVLLLLIGFSVWTIWAMQPPAPLPGNAPEAEFSATRAFAHVREIGREPHAMGTQAHANVRLYLLDQLRALKLEVQVQETTVSHRRGGSVGYVFNLIGRLKGQKPGRAGGPKAGPRKAVLMLAHYDSQPNARGAADDGSSVAAILETARALQKGPALQHDVIFLLTDGEEYGLYGAQAFVRHPWAKDVGFVMNLEARGVRGPSMTFEITSENGWAVDALAHAPYPLASSLMYEIYRILPNSTDFTVFRLAGYSGLNSAYIDGFVHYHKLTDSPQNLDWGTLQHHGSNLLALTRYVGNQSLDQTKAPDKVFFNTIGFHFVQYPLSLNWFFVGFLTVALLITVVLGVRKKVLTVGQSLAGAGLFLLMLVLILALLWPITVGVRHLLPAAFNLRVAENSPFSFAYYINGIYGSDRFLVAYSLLTVGLFGILTRLVLRWIRPFSLLMGVYLLLYVLVMLLAFRAPATTYQFMFPLLFSVLGTLVVLYWNLYQREKTTVHDSVALVAALPTLLLIPLVRLLFVTFDLQLPIVGAMLLFAIALGLLLPVGFGIERALRWRNNPTLALAALGLGLLTTVWAIRAEAPSAEQPIHSQVSYYLDADTRKAYWASSTHPTDHWNEQFFGKPTLSPFTEFYPAGQGQRLPGQRQRLINDATVLPIEAPTAEVLSDSNTATSRTLQIKLRSVRGAAGFELGLVVKDTADLQAVFLNNEPVKGNPMVMPNGQGQLIQVICNGLPLNKEMTLTVKTRPQASLQLLIYDQSMTLPASLVKVPRPADVMYEQGAGSNQTVVRKAYRF
ncbi:MAG: M20/M25/M40 family metallo-hydrolase [Rudanella sp.]|nr:M20/M25/M40 family metallo-hydrolase [Rudanella sp.]